MPDPVAISVEIVSDIACPWCFLGKRRLDAAGAQVADTVTLTRRWRPFLLDPSIPAGGLPYRAYLAAKFGDAHALDAAHARLAALGAEVGIAYDFAAIERRVDTLDAHRVMLWAAEAEVADAAAEALFKRQFVEPEDLADPAVLAAAAAEAGLDGDEVADWLATDVDRERVRAEVAEMQRIGVTGVPFMIFEGKYAISGAQEADLLAGALAEMAAEKRFGAKV
jgi:predicted DsbA family dithiol-disulfide isomerase